MFNTFEQGHNKWLEPPEPVQRGLDWKGYPYFKGDIGYLDEDGDFIPDTDLKEWVMQKVTEVVVQ